MIHKTNYRQTAHNSFKQCTKCGLEGNTKNCRILKSKRLLMPTVTSVKHNSTLPILWVSVHVFPNVRIIQCGS